MNQQFDLIIIGDSAHGNDAVKNIASAKNAIKIAFVSRVFKQKTTRDFLNVEYIQDEVILINYNRRLFGCYLAGGDRLFSTHVIIATGLDYSPLFVHNMAVPSVFNNTDEITKAARQLQAIVLGDDDEAAKLALKVAKKYKYVYFCTEQLQNSISTKLKQKLSALDNLVMLPNATIVKFNATDGVLQNVELSNYAALTCSAIYVKTKASPATTFVPANLFVKDLEGFLTTSTAQESTIVPKIYATGNCVRTSSKKANLAMYEAILTDF